MTRLRCGVLGAGRIGRIHATNLARAVTGAELVAVADVNVVAAEQLIEALGGGRAYADYRELLASAEVEAVAICTPTSTHFEVIMAAAAAGKTIFTEKPIDLALSKIDEINAEVDRLGVPLMVAFQRRFDPDFSTIRNMVQSGAIGNVHIVRISSRDSSPPPEAFVPTSGGLFMDMTIHDLDLVRYLVGSEVTGVFAKAAVLVDPMFARYHDWDTAVLTVTFANGAIGAIDNSRKTAYGYDQRAEVFGSKGMVTVGNHALDHHTYFNETGRHSAPLLGFFPHRYQEAYRLEMQAFVDAARSGSPMPVTGHDGRQAVVIAQAAEQSAREGRFISL
jgi:myo-inositol 2-dehydrogenase / D-chiro-inositol 1-dehydrogenase